MYLGGAILEPRVEMVLKVLSPPFTLFGILVLLGQGKSFVVRGIGLAGDWISRSKEQRIIFGGSISPGGAGGL